MDMQLMKPGHMYLSISTTELLITVCNHQHLYAFSVSIKYKYTKESSNRIRNNLMCFWRGHIFCQRLILNCIITLYWFPFITKHIQYKTLLENTRTNQTYIIFPIGMSDCLKGKGIWGRGQSRRGLGTHDSTRAAGTVRVMI